jgi:hypothetical protein
MTTTTLHAHIETLSVDCDGPLYRNYCFTLTDDEKADQFGDLVFRDRVLGAMVTWWPAEGAECTVRITRDGFTTDEPTEEGSRGSQVRWCEDAGCDTNQAGQRDVFAEQMGY